MRGKTCLVSFLSLQWYKLCILRIPLRGKLKVLTEWYAWQKLQLPSSWPWAHMLTAFPTHFCMVKWILTGVEVSSSWSPCLLSNNSAVRAPTHSVRNSGYSITCQRVSSVSVQHNLCGQHSGWVTGLGEVCTNCASRHSLLWSKTR